MVSLAIFVPALGFPDLTQPQETLYPVRMPLGLIRVPTEPSHRLSEHSLPFGCFFRSQGRWAGGQALGALFTSGSGWDHTMTTLSATLKTASQSARFHNYLSTADDIVRTPTLHKPLENCLQQAGATAIKRPF